MHVLYMHRRLQHDHKCFWNSFTGKELEYAHMTSWVHSLRQTKGRRTAMCQTKNRELLLLKPASHATVM